MNNQSIEQEIQSKGLTAPRVTLEEIESRITSEHYFTEKAGAAALTAINKGETPDALGLLTFCVLVLRNGFAVTGESACVSLENFDAEIGRKIARQNAIQKVGPLMGYALREQIHVEGQA